MNDQFDQKSWPTDRHVVTIITGNGKPSVSPPTLYLRSGNTIWFRVISTKPSPQKTHALLFFPKDLSQEGGAVVKFKVLKLPTPPNAEWTKYKLHKKCLTGKHPYAIYSMQDNDFVEVNSSPSMIVENDD